MEMLVRNNRFYIRKSITKDLSYFKRELLKVLHKKIEKSINIYDVMQKGKAATIGEIRVWKGEKFRKIAPGKWRKVYESNSRGAKHSISILKKKIENAKNTDELLQLVMENTNRFMDSKGQLLPIVEELKKTVNEKKVKLNEKKLNIEINESEKERINLITSIIEYPSQDLQKGKIKTLKTLYSHFTGDSKDSKLYRLALEKLTKEKVTKENVIEKLSNFLKTKGIKSKNIEFIADFTEKRQNLFHDFHKDYNKRNTDNNPLQKALNFEDFEKVLGNYDIKVSEALMQSCSFDDIKQCTIGLLEFINDFPLVNDLIPKLTKSRNDFIMAVWLNNNENPLEISFGRIFTEKGCMKKQEGYNTFFHAGDGQLNAESFGYHEGAHVLGILLKKHDLYSPVQICKKAYEKIKEKKLKGLSYEDAKLTISDYSVENAEELFAEAFADVYQYGENASPFSLEIVKIAKSEYNTIRG